ncbi:allergen asp f 4 protein [Rutstroemia sp. NJR-2017a BBW]|nr:allergen asp f 4 protein [Rutstroemia sp. NJR-2017a BBW]
MRYSTTAIVLAAMAVGEAVAGPTHVHKHRHLHEKKSPNPVDWSALDWEDMGIDWSSAWAKGQASKTAAAAVESTTAPASSVASVTSVTHGVVAAATSVVSSAAAAASSSSSSSESIGDLIEDLFDELVGCSNTRKAFGAIVSAAGSLGDNYRGNYGSPYGSNVIKVSSKSSYSYTAEFHNTQSKSITVNIWNKVGPDGRDLSGSALAPKNTTLTFVLAAGASQIVAFDENSQVAWAEACSSTAASGAYATTWGEANFVKTGSGYDMSAIMNANGNDYNMSISSSEAPDCTSDPTQNYWLTDTQPIGNSDGSCFIAQSTATLKVVMGGKM